MMRRGVVFMVVGLAGSMVLDAVPAQSQTATFQKSSTYAISGTSLDATGLMVLDDFGRFPDGPEDGNLDIVTVGQEQGRITTLYGNGQGRFLPGPTSLINRVPTGLAAGLLDGDNVKDLLFTDTASQVLCYKGFTDGSPYELVSMTGAILRNPSGVDLADVNRDQILDAIVVSEGDQAAGGITVLLGNGDCSFSVPAPPADSQVMAGLASAAAAVGDFNKDNNLDIAVANAFSNNVPILRRDAQGRYTTTQTLDVGDEPIAIEAVDLNNDTRLDLVVTNRNSDSVAVLLARSDNSFNQASFFQSGSVGSSPTGLAVGDLNLDGNPDVVVPNNRSSDVSFLLGDGLGGLRPPRVFVSDQEPLAAAVGLLNADAAPDAAVINRGNQGPNAAVLLGLADGTAAAVEDLVTQGNPNSIAVGDFDNNALCDVMASHPDGSLRPFASSFDEGLVAQSDVDTGMEINEVLAGDFDGNGLLDVVTVNRATGAGTPTATVFAASGDGGFEVDTTLTLGGEPTSGLAVDMNRDGRADIAIIRSTQGIGDAIDIFLANNQGGFAPRVSYNVGETAVEVDFGDCNNDGRLDLLVANNQSADVSILVGNAQGTFTAAPARLIDGAPKAIAVSDFNRDGFDDFAVALSMTGGVLIYFSNGSCNFARGQQALPVGTPSGLAARDFSGDGLPDILVTDEVANAASLFTKSPGDNQLFQRLAGDADIIVSRRPTLADAGDFDGDGRYDGSTVNSFVAGSASVLTNILAPGLLRGDGNNDGEITAADLVATMLEIADGGSPRVEEAPRGAFAGGLQIDANGDGVVTLQDAVAVAARTFEL